MPKRRYLKEAKADGQITKFRVRSSGMAVGYVTVGGEVRPVIKTPGPKLRKVNTEGIAKVISGKAPGFEHNCIDGAIIILDSATGKTQTLTFQAKSYSHASSVERATRFVRGLAHKPAPSGDEERLLIQAVREKPKAWASKTS